MVQSSNGLGFLLKSLAVLFLDLLDRHDAAKARVPRLPHFSHPSRTDLRKDFVRAEAYTWRKQHSSSERVEEQEELYCGRGL
jgi:hypothetical protein